MHFSCFDITPNFPFVAVECEPQCRTIHVQVQDGSNKREYKPYYLSFSYITFVIGYRGKNPFVLFLYLHKDKGLISNVENKVTFNMPVYYLPMVGIANHDLSVCMGDCWPQEDRNQSLEDIAKDVISNFWQSKFNSFKEPFALNKWVDGSKEDADYWKKVDFPEHKLLPNPFGLVFFSRSLS